MVKKHQIGHRNIIGVNNMNTIKINRFKVSTDGERVEFYYIMENGENQFAGRYMVDSFLEVTPRRLKLDTSVKEWTVEAYEMTAIMGWLRGVIK